MAGRFIIKCDTSSIDIQMAVAQTYPPFLDGIVTIQIEAAMLALKVNCT